MRIYIFGYSVFFGKNREMTSVVEILSLIAEPKCSTIFRTMGEFGEPTELHITRLNMTRKQFYSRLNQLIKSDLVKRSHGKYELTLFGKVVFEIEEKIQHSIDNYWKLKAIDSVNSSNGISANEFKALIDVLIEYKEMKAILLRNSF